VAVTLRQQLEDAVIAALKAKIGRAGNPGCGYLAAAEPYNGEVSRAEGPDDLRAALRGRSPCVLVAAGTAIFDSRSTQRTKYTRTITLELFAVSNHHRTRPSRLRSDVVAQANPTADPGIYRIAEDVHLAISGVQVTSGIDGLGPIMPRAEDVVLQLDDLTVWRLAYEVDTDANLQKLDWGDRDLTGYAIDGNMIDDDGETPIATPPNPFVEADETY
jgi:hypothetical protein